LKDERQQPLAGEKISNRSFRETGIDIAMISVAWKTEKYQKTFSAG
jgi:hypothetical protein